MVMKENSLGVGVQDTKIIVNLDTCEGLRTERLKMFKKINFVVILISFEFDKFCRLISFVG